MSPIRTGFEEEFWDEDYDWNEIVDNGVFGASDYVGDEIEPKWKVNEALKKQQYQVARETGCRVPNQAGSFACRMVFGNINGLKLDDNGKFLRQVCQEVRSLGIDHLGLSEINCDDTNFDVRDRVYSVCRNEFNHHVIETSTSRLQMKSRYKPGGTMSLVQSNLVGRIMDRGGDEMGRWSFIRYRGKNNRNVTVVSSYQVCVRPTHQHGTTAYHQQVIMLTEDNRPNLNPRYNFQLDLMEFLRTKKAAGDSLVVYGDFNEVFDDDSWIYADKDVPLVDVVRAKHPNATKASTYLRGQNRIDYVFATPEVLPMIHRCGYLPFHSHFRSDHRFAYMDIDLINLLGGISNELCAPAMRGFRSSDPKAVERYLIYTEKYLRDHNFFRRLHYLCEDSMFDPELAEKLDKIMTKACLYAERKITKKQRSWFSSRLNEALEKKAVLRTILTGFKNGKHLEAMLKSAKNRCLKTGLDFPLPKTIQEAHEFLTAAQKEVDACDETSRSLRESDLDAKALRQSKIGNITHATALKQLKEREQTVMGWKKIGKIMKKANLSGITLLHVPESWPGTEQEFRSAELEDPKKCTNWRTVDMPAEIDFYLRMRNQMHFGQAQGTPFTVPPLSVMFDWGANSITTELVLDGQYSNDELDDIQQLLLKHCEKEADDIIANEITEDEFRGRLKSWKEDTTTSPSGMHLGHAKALIVKLPEETDEEKALVEKQSAIFQGRHKLMNYGLKHGYSYTRWRKIVNAVLEKDPGNPKIHRLRIIHLYEYDLGACMAILWQKLLKKSEQRGTINAGQFGGRKGHEARDLAFMEELKVDICLASRKALINFDNDAASCYDRIIPTLASVLARKKGMHHKVTLLHAQTLKEARYKLKTAMGVSEEEYSHSELYPIYGTGQGSTNSPIIWVIISSTLFDMHNEEANGAIFCSPDGSVVASFSISGFVDDANCQTNAFRAKPQPSVDELVSMAQQDAQLWSDLLHLSGGYVETSKSSYHLIAFEFTEAGKPRMIGGRVGPPIKINDAITGDVVEIQQKSVFQAHKTLGHYKAPAGTFISQHLELKKRADKMAELVRKSSLSSSEAFKIYHALYVGWIRYSLPQCALSTTQLGSIDKTIGSVLLQKMGFPKTFPLAVRFAPVEYGGVGMVPLNVIQGEGQVVNMLRLLRAGGPVKKMAQIAISWAQYQAGVKDPILETPAAKLPHLEVRLLQSIRKFLQSIGGKIILKQNFVPPIQREKDFYIMDMVLESSEFTDAQVRLVNYCRMYLDVVLASDMVNPSGKKVDSALRARGRHHRSPHSYSRQDHYQVNQPLPGKQAWWQWIRACNMLDRKLRDHPLGRWTRGGAMLRRHWNAYVDEDATFLYVRHQQGYAQYIRTQDDEYYVYDGKEICPEWTPTSTCVPVNSDLAETVDGEIYVDEGCVHHLLRPKLSPVSTDFMDVVQTLPLWERMLLCEIRFLEYGPFELMSRCEQMASSDDKFQLIVVGDGSAGGNSMAFGWVLSLPSGEWVVEGAGPAFGAIDTSNRSEGYGCLSPMRFLLRWYQFCDRTPSWMTIFHSDNKNVINKVTGDLTYDEPWPNTTLEPDWDVRQEIKMTIRSVSSKVNLRHVKGHQDKNVDVASLSLEARMNVRADELAGEYRTRNLRYRPSVVPLPSTEAYVEIQGKTVTGKYSRAIREALALPKLRQYLLQRYNWDESVLDLLDWSAFTTATKRMKKKHVAITKFIHGWAPTNRQQQKYSVNVKSLCPRCKQAEETAFHVVRCSSSEVSKWRSALYEALRSRCEKLKTREGLLDVLLQGLMLWCKGEVIRKERFPRSLHQLIVDQTKVGWGALFHGRFVHQWSVLQQHHLDTRVHQKKEHETGCSWTASIIVLLWNHYFEVWDQRNKVVHGHDAMESKTLRKQQLLDQLQLLHDEREAYLPAHRSLLLAPTANDDKKVAEFVERNSVQSIQAHIRWTKPILEASKREANAKKTTRNRGITDYFPVVRQQVRNAARALRGALTTHIKKGKQQRKQVSRQNRIDGYFQRRCPTVRIPEFED